MFAGEPGKEKSTEMEVSAGEPVKTDYAYDDDAIQSLVWNEHIRRRPGMYIGKLGDAPTPTTESMCSSRR